MLIVSMTLGMGSVAVETGRGQTETSNPGISRENSMVFAQNEAGTTAGSETTAPANDSDATTPEAKQTTETDSRSTGKKTAPLKPFEPSEEIAAEQAVDFPADI